jgi:hypothetical protein
MTDEHSDERAPSWSWFALIGLCVLFLIIGGVRSCNKANKENDDSKQKIESSSWNTEKITVNFTAKYKDTLYLPAGKELSFEGATEAYCLHNLSAEYCAEAGEDVGKQISNTTANTRLMFKSRNGKTGQITVVIWTKK